MSSASNRRNLKSTEAVFHGLLRTLGLLRQVMEPYFGRFGISGPQWGVLRVLQRAESKGESGLRLKDIGQRLFIQPPSVTAVVDRLERQGLVKRSSSKADLRVRRVSLTTEARKFMSVVLEVHGDQIKSLFTALSSRELDQLHTLLTKLNAHLEGLVPRRAVPTLLRRTSTGM